MPMQGVPSLPAAAPRNERILAQIQEKMHHPEFWPLRRSFQIEMRQCGDLKGLAGARKRNRSPACEFWAAYLMLITAVWPALSHCGVRMPTRWLSRV